MASRGESKTRWSARVSSTAPRLEPRCPPLTETASISTSRISSRERAQLVVVESAQRLGSVDRFEQGVHHEGRAVSG